MLITVESEARATLIHDRLRHAPGLIAKRSGVQGWHSRPGVRRDDVSRSSQHGSFATDGFWQARVITVDGIGVARSRSELQHLGDQFQAMLGASELARFSVEEDGETRWAQVQAWGETDWGHDRWKRAAGGLVWTDFMVQLRAPSPWKFGESHRVQGPGSLELVNRGTQNAWPVLHFRGPRPSRWSVQIGDRELTVARSLSSSQWVEVDTRSGITRTNAAPGGYLLEEVTGLHPFVPPGLSTLLIDDGGPVTVEFSDTYI